MFPSPPASYFSKPSASEGRNSRLRDASCRGPAASCTLFVVLNQGKNVELGQLRSSIQECQLHGKRRPIHSSAQLLNQLRGRRGGASRGQQVVANDHFLSGFDRVFVNFQCVRAVFQFVGNAGGLRRQFLRFAHRNESRLQPVRQRRSENKSARFDPRNHVDVVAFVVFAEPVNQRMKAVLVLEQRRQVVKQDSRLRIIRHFAYQPLQVVHVNGSS